MKDVHLGKHKLARGFTLLELLIVVIVVGILAAVVLPQFTNMANRARSTEATNAVGALLTAEWVYYQERNTFSGNIAELLVNIDNTNYTYASSAVSAAGVTWTGSGVAATPHAGISVQGSMTNTGARTINDPVLP